MRDKVNGSFLSYSRFESSNELERDHAFQSRHFLNVQAKNSNLFFNDNHFKKFVIEPICLLVFLKIKLKDLGFCTTSCT